MKGLTLSSVITLCIVSWRFAKRDYSSAVPATESNQAIEAIPRHVQISAPEQIFGAFEPIPSSEKIPVETAVTKIEIEYEPSWADQWMTLLENEHTLWYILSFLVPIIISFLVFLVRYRHVVRVRLSKENEGKEDKNYVLDLKAVAAFIQEFEERFGPLDNCTDSQKMMMTAEHERYFQFQSENDSAETNFNATDKIQSAAQKETGSIKTIEEDDCQKELDSMNTMKEKIEEERFPQFSIKMDSVKEMIELEHESHSQFPNEVDLMDTMRKTEDERRDQVQKEVNSVEIIDEGEEQPADSRYDVDSITMFQHKFPAQLQNGLYPLDVIEEEDEDFADSQNEVDPIKTMMMNGEDKHDAKTQRDTDLMNVFEDEDAQPANSENEVDFMKTVMMDEFYAQFPNEMDSLEGITKGVYKPCTEVQRDVFSMETVDGEVDRPSCSQNEMDSKKKTTVKVEDKRHAEVQNEIDLKEIINGDGKDRVDSQNAMHSVRTILLNMRDEHLPASLNEAGLMNIMNERLSLKREERTARDEVPIESLVRMERYKTLSIQSSRASGEKKEAEMKKVRQGLPPPRIHEAVKTKVASQSNKISSRGERQVKKTRDKKPDYSKVQAKVRTWRKVKEHDEAMDRIKERYDHLSDKVSKSGSVMQPGLKGK
jgi:hypothetical protein